MNQEVDSRDEVRAYRRQRSARSRSLVDIMQICRLDVIKTFLTSGRDMNVLRAFSPRSSEF